jgi:hypothetical protein
LLVEQHSDQQRDRIIVQQGVSGRVLNELQFRHPASLGLRGSEATLGMLHPRQFRPFAIDTSWRDTAGMPQENRDIAWRWLKGEGSPLPLISRLPDAIRLAGAIATGPLSRRPVRPLGDEARRPLPGDKLVPGRLRWTHGVTIRARPTTIWPWLVQSGCRRAGPYSYDRLDNGGVPSADRIIPELQHIEVGDILPWTPTADDGFIVRAIEPERALVLGENTGSISWAFVLEPIDATSTRLITRAQSWYESLAFGLMLRLVFRPIHFGMQRRQLLNLKQRVEATAAAGSS